MTKDAVHIRTKGFYCNACPLVVEQALRPLPGVIDVVAVRSMGLTSILFDSDRISRDNLRARIRSAGFGAELLACDADECELRPDRDLHTQTDRDGGARERSAAS